MSWKLRAPRDHGFGSVLDAHSHNWRAAQRHLDDPVREGIDGAVTFLTLQSCLPANELIKR